MFYHDRVFLLMLDGRYDQGGYSRCKFMTSGALSTISTQGDGCRVPPVDRERPIEATLLM